MHTLNRRHAPASSRRISPELCFRSAPLQEGGRREGRVPACTRGPLRKRHTQKTAQQHTGVAKHTAFPARWSDGLCRALPGAELSFWPPSPRELTMPSARLGSRTSPQRLDRSNDGQDHTVLPHAAHPASPTGFAGLRRRSSARGSRTHRDYPPCPPHLVPTPPRPPQPGPRFERLANRPSSWAGLCRCMPQFRISVKWNIFARRG
jgi:hypothetical protein